MITVSTMTRKTDSTAASIVLVRVSLAGLLVPTAWVSVLPLEAAAVVVDDEHRDAAEKEWVYMTYD